MISRRLTQRELTESLIETLREEIESYHTHWLKLNEILSELENDLYAARETIAERDATVEKQRKIIGQAYAYYTGNE